MQHACVALPAHHRQACCELAVTMGAMIVGEVVMELYVICRTYYLHCFSQTCCWATCTCRLKTLPGQCCAGANKQSETFLQVHLQPQVASTSSIVQSAPCFINGCKEQAKGQESRRRPMLAHCSGPLGALISVKNAIVFKTVQHVPAPCCRHHSYNTSESHLTSKYGRKILGLKAGGTTLSAPIPFFT